jgi:hypothetical protein
MSIFMKMKTKIELIDFIKANRRGSREFELEFSTGWTSKHKIHSTEKIYSRKKKHKDLENRNN